MTDLSKANLEAIEATLNKEAEATPRPADVKKIFIGIPNLGQLNVSLIMNLFEWAKDTTVLPWFHFCTEQRPTDHARNVLAAEFLSTECEYLVMIDADCATPNNFLTLHKLDKDIIAGKVHCWINNQLMPSVWQLAECEECVNVKKFMETGKIHDESLYRAKGDTLYRWNPEDSVFRAFATRQSGILKDQKCRCKDTGWDPWVYRSWQKPWDPQSHVIRVDSVGTAAIMIHRRVFEHMQMPYFRFYYKFDRKHQLTEDHYFCWRAQLEGFKVYADMAMVCSHFKSVNLAAVEAAMMKVFERGVEYGRKQVEAESNKPIILPTSKDMEMVMKPFPIKNNA